MSRWRIALVVLLISVPFIGWAVAGSIYLWMDGLGIIVWWPMMACVALGYLLAWYWQRKRRLLRPPEFEAPMHWTPRDKEAFKLVAKHAEEGAKAGPEKLTDPKFYYETGRAMADELARFYHPGASDPLGNLTVPELLSVVELAARDLREMVDEHLPGGHLLTIDNFRLAQSLSKWYTPAMNVYWAISALFDPLNTALRFGASKIGVSTPLQMLQENLYAWFFTAFVHRLGTYLIDLNSGRLRVGVERYRQLQEEAAKAAEQAPDVAEKVVAGPFIGRDTTADDAVDQIRQMTIALVGQVKAGKSSLVNALLGEERARTAVTPMTAGIERFELLTPGVPTRLVLLDTAGYNQTGATAEQVKDTAEAARQADVVFLVLHARNPARKADVELLEQLEKWFAERPDLKPPPIVAVLSHVDLLSPSLEWSPPYDWRHPKRPKEQSIHDAAKAAREQMGPRLVDLAPVCAQPGKTWGVEEELLPSVAAQLEEVRGVALLRCLKAEADREKVKKVFRQMYAAGKAAASIAWQMLNKK
jgi:predicted GTPase